MRAMASRSGVGEVGAGGEQGGQLALADLVGVVAELLEQGAGGLLVAEQGITGRGLALDDQECGIDPFLPSDGGSARPAPAGRRRGRA